MDYTKSPLLDITLPPVLYVVSFASLMVIYASILVFDYLLLQYGRRFIPSSVVTTIIGIIHFFIPLVVICDIKYLDFIIAMGQVLVIVYGCSFPMENFSLTTWIIGLIETTYEVRKTDADLLRSTAEIRLLGLFRFVKACLKFYVGVTYIDYILPAETSTALSYPYFSTESIFFMTIYALKFYCFTAILDMGFGLEQLILGIQTVNSMRKPYLASGPRDFWGRRWNMYVTYFMHSQVFARKSSADHKKNDDAKKPVKRNNTIRGLTSYFVSGLLHEIIIMSVCRKITLECTTFFMIQGLGALIEIKIKKWIGIRNEPVGLARVISIVLNMSFMLLTSRLFFAPLLRDAFFPYNFHSLYLNMESSPLKVFSSPTI